MKVNPAWIAGAISIAPVALTRLIIVTPTQGRIGLVYGMRITSQEVNAAGKTWQFGYVSPSPSFTTIFTHELDVLNPIIDSNIPLLIIAGGGGVGFVGANLVAGTAATRHQAWLKYAEVDPNDLSIVLGGGS